MLFRIGICRLDIQLALGMPRENHSFFIITHSHWTLVDSLTLLSLGKGSKAIEYSRTEVEG